MYLRHTNFILLKRVHSKVIN